MKKTLVLTMALAISGLTFAQKKEIKEAEKALKAENFTEAKSILNTINTASLDAKTFPAYYLALAKAYYANGEASDEELNKAIEALKKADNSELSNAMIQNFLKKGNDNYTAKKYDLASLDFENVYKVSAKDTAFLYNAAISADIGQDYDRALKLYQDLKKTGYTGIEKEYYAIEKATGNKTKIGSESERTLLLKSGEYIKPIDEFSKSKQPEIVKRIAALYIAKGEKDKAIKAVQEARKQNPKDVNLVINEANLYYDLNETEKYKELIKEAIELDPTNVDLFYNLGVISADAKDYANAEKYYKKALEINPDYLNAKTNLAVLILAPEAGIIEEMNGLGNSAADNKRYDELKEQRLALYRKAIPYLEGVLKQAPDNVEAISTLAVMYSAVGKDAKAKEMRAKAASLKN